jgi:putative YphP/YqiW family bacilliredoxin
MTAGDEMYPEIMVIPMREELTRLGIQELRTAAEVDRAIAHQPGITMLVINSVCGCAAGRMRPAVRIAIQHSNRPEKIFTVSPDRTKRPRNALAPISPGTRPRHLQSRSCATAGWST